MMMRIRRSFEPQTKVVEIATIRAGFSLIEMVLALTLIALIVGIGAIGYSNGRDERVLRKAASKVEALASRGHAMAILHQKPFWIRLEEDRLILAGADTTPEPLDDAGDEAQWEEWSYEEEQKREKIYEEFSTEALIHLRRWGANEADWQRPKKGEFIVWHFQSTGLCEPVSFKIEQAESWIVMHMHPLTARVEEEEMSIQ